MSEFHHTKEPRLNMSQLLQANFHGNPRLRRIAHAFSWRQIFQNSSYYELKMEGGSVIKVTQISNGEIKGLGTGTLVWPAAHVLSKYFEKRFFTCSSLQNKRVCDIGSGTGITGFVAATLGATVVLTDQECILPLLEENTQHFYDNFPALVKEQVTVKNYEWGTDISHLGLPFDYVLVSDCVLPKLYPIDILVKAVDAVMSDHTIAFFSYEHRPYPEYDPRHEFERLAKMHGMKVRVVPLSEHHDCYSAEDIEIWEVTRARNSGEHPDVDASVNGVAVYNWGNVASVDVSINDVAISVRQDLGGVIGSIVWPSSVIAARYILKTPFTHLQAMVQANPVLDKSTHSSRPVAVDLGSGCGLAAMALVCAGYDTIATDKACVMGLLTENLNNFQAAVRQHTKSDSLATGSVKGILELDWNLQEEVSDAACLAGTIKGLLDHCHGEYPDLVVCSDCLYSSASVTPLLDVLDQLSNSMSGLLVLLVNEMRTAFDEFTYLARRHMDKNVTFKEIYLPEPELELFRGSSGRVASPPLRMTLMSIQRRTTS